MPATIVTSENLEAFHAEHLPKATVTVSPEDKPADKEAKPDAKAEGKVDDKPAEKVEKEEPDEAEAAKKKAKLATRFSELAQARKDAEATAVRERERADAAEARAAAAEAKLNPPKEAGDGKPDPKSYADPFKYAEDLAEWTADKKIKDAAKAEADKKAGERSEQMTETWKGRVAEFEKETPDYKEVLSSSTLAVHDVIKDAIIESDLGPAILYALASDDDLAEKFKIPLASSREEQGEAVRKQLRHLGRLEAKLEKAEKTEAKADKKDDTPKKETPRAPDPITPVKGTARGDGPPQNASAAEYRAWRESHMGQRVH